MATKEQRIFIRHTESGKLQAGTNTSPFFCLEAGTESALFDRVKKAVAFYQKHRQNPTPPRAVVSVTGFTPSRVVDREELQVA